MKVYRIDTNKLVRIEFRGGKSISFTDTTIEEVFDTAIKTFKNVVVGSEVKLVNHCPLNKPETTLSTVMSVREEEGILKGKSKSKQLYGLTPMEAYDLFVNNYEKHLK